MRKVNRERIDRMRKVKVIILLENICTKRDYHRFGAEYLESVGYEVELWQVILGKPRYLDYKEWEYSGNNYYQLNKNDFARRVADNKNAVYIIQGGFYTFVHWILCKYNCKFIMVYAMTPLIRGADTPSGDSMLERIALLERIKRTVVRLIKRERRLKDYFVNIKHLFEEYESKFINDKCRTSKTSPMAIITSTRHLASVYFPKDVLKKEILFVHAGNYDTYIETQRVDPKQRETHIVYCDSGYADKTYNDVRCGYGDRECYIYREEYYRQMEFLFQKLEKFYGVPVVISGHPHTVYDQMSFGGRAIIRGNTCELTRDAKLFITNASTAMSFAILYNKPILLVQNEHFKNNVDGCGFDNSYSNVKYIAEDALKIGFINMSNPEEMERPWEKCKKVPERERDEFIRKYIIDTDKTEKTVIEYIEEMLREL